jgi:hypothetical protein
MKKAGEPMTCSPGAEGHTCQRAFTIISFGMGWIAAACENIIIHIIGLQHDPALHSLRRESNPGSLFDGCATLGGFIPRTKWADPEFAFQFFDVLAGTLSTSFLIVVVRVQQTY